MNWGCGSIQPSDWTNVDHDPSFQAAYMMTDLLPESSFDVIIANHSLQMVAYEDVPPILSEFNRLLRSGGVLRILVPNISAAITAYQSGNRAFFPVNMDTYPDIDDAFALYLTWFGSTKTIFTPGMLRRCLMQAGFVTAEQGQFGCGGGAELDSREDEQPLIIEAIA